jgi:hypothetical protein
MRTGVVQATLVFLFLFRVHVKAMPATSHHVELVLYVAIVATYCKTTLLVSYLESYLNDLVRLMRR